MTGATDRNLGTKGNRQDDRVKGAFAFTSPLVLSSASRPSIVGQDARPLTLGVNKKIHSWEMYDQEVLET